MGVTVGDNIRARSSTCGRGIDVALESSLAATRIAPTVVMPTART